VIVKKILVLLASSCMLSACLEWEPTDYASNDKKQFLKSKNGAAPVVPKPLTSSNISDFYNLPDQNQNAKVSVDPPVVK
jgi:uncharacterized lipoprotein